MIAFYAAFDLYDIWGLVGIFLPTCSIPAILSLFSISGDLVSRASASSSNTKRTTNTKKSQSIPPPMTDP
jgi:hypothetical protein